MGRLLELPMFITHSFDQGEYGARCKAPTTLLLLRMPGAASKLNDTQNNGRAPRGKFEALRGRNKDGSWKTAMKKLYPDALCSTLADIMLESALMGTDEVEAAPAPARESKEFSSMVVRLVESE